MLMNSARSPKLGWVNRCTPNRPWLRACCAQAVCTAPLPRAHCAVSWRAVCRVAGIGGRVAGPLSAVSPLCRARPYALYRAYRSSSPNRVAPVSQHNPAAKPRAYHDTPIRIATQSLNSQALASTGLPCRKPCWPCRGPVVAVSWPLLIMSQGCIVVVPCLSLRALARLCHDTVLCIVTQNKEWAVAHPVASDQVFFFSLSYYWKTSQKKQNIYFYIYI